MRKELELEFDEEFVLPLPVGEAIQSNTTPDNIKEFIDQHFIAKKDLEEEIKKMGHEVLHSKHVQCGDPCWLCHYDIGCGLS